MDGRQRLAGRIGRGGGLLLLLATLALSAAYVYLYQFSQSLGGEKWDALGAIGQAIGAWATSVSFLVLIASLWSQRRQLQLQHNALEAQAEDLKNQRSALEQTASAIAAQVFLQVLESAERTLARDMRAILQLCGAPLSDEIAALDRQAAERKDYSVYAEYFASSAAAREFLRTHVAFNPVLHDAAERYCTAFEALKSLAGEARLQVSLFEMALDNAGHSKAYRIIKDALSDSASPFGHDTLEGSELD